MSRAQALVDAHGWGNMPVEIVSFLRHRKRADLTNDGRAAVVGFGFDGVFANAAIAGSASGGEKLDCVAWNLR